MTPTNQSELDAILIDYLIRNRVPQYRLPTPEEYAKAHAEQEAMEELEAMCESDS